MQYTAPPTPVYNLTTQKILDVGAIVPRYRPGFVYMGSDIEANSVTVNGELIAYPFFTEPDMRLDRIGVGVTSSGGLGSVIRLGIYNDDGHGAPGTLLPRKSRFCIESCM